MIEVKMYKCEYCGKVYASKSYCEKKHEPRCYWNPQTKSCITCVNFISEKDNCGDRECKVGKDIQYKLTHGCYSYQENK